MAGNTGITEKTVAVITSLKGDRSMIDITERAKKELKALLTDNVDHPAACLRLRTNEEGKLGIGIDIETPGDKVIEYEGCALLLVETELADSLEGVAIDVIDNNGSSELVITNIVE
jgi:Fe-S cluster assembly iron-binding protein IscA